MKKAVLVLLFFGVIGMSNGVAQIGKTTPLSEEPGDSTAAGFMMKVEDVFWQTGWHPVSLDRMSVMIDSYTFGRYGPQPEFVLDGIPFDPTFMGITYSQLFPLPVHQIKKTSVSAKDGFGIRDGVPYQSGIVALRSERLKQGLSLFGSAQIGHNSGEPGPWVFDPESVTPNVERFGPWLDGGAGLRFGGWYAKAVVKKHSYQHFNDFLQTRTINLVALPESEQYFRPDAETVFGLVETGYESDRMTIRLQGIESDSEEFLFFQPMGREVPTNMQWQQYSGLADIGITQNLGVRSLVQWKEQSLGYRVNQFFHDFDWLKREQLIRGSLYYQTDDVQITIGADRMEPEIEAPGLEWQIEGVTGLFSDIAMDFSDRVSAGVSAAMQTDGNNQTRSLSGFGAVKPAKMWQIQLKSGYSELFGWQASPVDSWARSGYTIFRQFGIEQAFRPPAPGTNVLPEKSRYRFIAVSNRITFSDVATLKAELQVTDHLALNIPFQWAFYDLPFSARPGFYFLFENQRGKRLQGTLALDHQLSPRLRQTLRVDLKRTIEGNSVYTNYWKTTPDVMVQHFLRFRPFFDLDIAINTQFIAERTWEEYEQLDGELNRTFHIQFPFRYFEFRKTLPSHIKIDLSVSKWFWNQRLRGVLQLKNILDQPYQTHPIGVREGFGYVARVELRL